jgi:hypothetical protein
MSNSIEFCFFFGSGFSPHFSSLFLLFPALLEERAALEVTQQLWASAVGCISTRLYDHRIPSSLLEFDSSGSDGTALEKRYRTSFFLSFFLSSFSFSSSSSSFLAATFVPLGGL